MGSARFMVMPFLVAAVLAMAQDWEGKPFTAWNASDVTKVLIDSPWVVLCPHTQRRVGGLQWVSYYRVRLLTAAPVRQAYLRYATFVPDRRLTGINYQDLQKEGTGDAAQNLYDKFVREFPDDIRLKGSDEYIVVCITETTHRRASDSRWMTDPWPPQSEQSIPDMFVDLQFSDLEGSAFLATDSRKVPIARFAPPSNDHLGAKFYFPRHLPLGNDWVTRRDKKLHFNLQIPRTTITATFDLGKLIYNGKLEI
jgi:hypothetical protein